MVENTYQVVVVGVSKSGLGALTLLLRELPANYSMPIIVVQHIHADSANRLSDLLARNSRMKVVEAIDKAPIEISTVYIAPAGHHLMVEAEQVFSLSVDPHVHFSRPSIDVLFESAVDVYSNKLVGVILTGANSDGAQGLKKIKAAGGLTLVQDPCTAEAVEMPNAAIDLVEVDKVLPIPELGCFLASLNSNPGGNYHEFR
jgi:two-component system chemotaxis response regulator CheB